MNTSNLSNAIPQPDLNVLVFPCSFPFKVMGLNTPEFADTILQVVQQFVPEISPAAMRSAVSAKGNYLALTFTFEAQSRQQLDALYLACTSHSLVKVVY